MAGTRTRNAVPTSSERDRWSAADTGRAGGTADPDTEARADPDAHGEAVRLLGRHGNLAALVALVAVVLIAMTLAVWFRGEADALRSRADTNNTALLNAQSTSQVNSQISTALETVYSYDFSTLDADQAAASEVVTGQFTEDYRALFAEVRELAPPQQAVVSAVVVNSAVKVLDGDRAELVVFLNQRGTKGATDEEIAAPGRLTVTAQQVDGQWKIAAVNNR